MNRSFGGHGPHEIDKSEHLLACKWTIWYTPEGGNSQPWNRLSLGQAAKDQSTIGAAKGSKTHFPFPLARFLHARLHLFNVDGVANAKF